MSLSFCNNRNVDLYAAWAMYYPSDCAGDRGLYVIKGWFRIPPHTCFIVSTDDMRGPSFMVYGEWIDGGITGGTRPVQLGNLPFERCINDIFIGGRTCRFTEFPRTSSNHTVTFN